jgi:integrase
MALEIIRLQPRITNWVFPGRVPGQHLQWLHKAVGRIKSDSGVDYVPHDLRRTAATMMASIGINRQVLRKILNHVDQEITAVYDRYSYEGEKREALMKWEGQLRLILTRAIDNRLEVAKRS